MTSNLRRCYKYTEHKNIIYTTGKLKLLAGTFKVYKGNKKIELNLKEFKILKLLGSVSAYNFLCSPCTYNLYFKDLEDKLIKDYTSINDEGLL